MKRIQLFEFEDFPWFPGWVRTCMTNVIVVFMRVTGLRDELAHQLGVALEKTGQDAIVDLGSGSGGVMPDVLERLRASSPGRFTLTMSDLYPSPDVVRRFEHANVEGMSYHPEPVDATDIATAPDGLKTMVNCFHHMPPDKAREILRSVCEHRQPFMIYEAAGQDVPLIFWWIFLPLGLTLVALMCMVFTLLVRPLTWRQLVFTYLVPVIPFFYAWDGQASFPRTYQLGDMKELLSGLERDDYVWEMGKAETEDGPGQGLYVLGYPR